MRRELSEHHLKATLLALRRKLLNGPVVSRDEIRLRE